MSSLIKKYKIYNQTHENIHDTVLSTKLKKKKWRFLIKQQFNNQFLLDRPITLKQLYKERLNERRKFKKFYGYLSNQKFKNTFNKIVTKNTSFYINNLTILLEQQVGIILWRLRLFPSIFKIYQIINHGYIKLNGIKITNFRTHIKPGDILIINPSVISFNNNKVIPAYLEYNKHVNIVTIIRKPLISDIQYSFNFNPVLIFDYLNNK